MSEQYYKVISRSFAKRSPRQFAKILKLKTGRDTSRLRILDTNCVSFPLPEAGPKPGSAREPFSHRQERGRLGGAAAATHTQGIRAKDQHKLQLEVGSPQPATSACLSTGQERRHTRVRGRPRVLVVKARRGSPRPLRDSGFCRGDPTTWAGPSVKLCLKPWSWQNQEQVTVWKQDSIS